MAKDLNDFMRERFTPEQIEDIEAEVTRELAEMDLAEIRKAAGVTQQEMAEIVDATQSELSRIERRTDHKVSTLRRYVEALGGELEVRAVFGGRTVRLLGTGSK